MSAGPKWARDRARDARNRCAYCGGPRRPECPPTCPRRWARDVTSPAALADARGALLAWVASKAPDGVPLAWDAVPADPRGAAYQAAVWARDANEGLTRLAVSRGWEPA